MRNKSLGVRKRLTRNWWTVVARGAIAIIFGLVALCRPTLTLDLLVYLFAGFWSMGGILLAIAAFQERLHDNHSRLLLLEGIIGIGVGAIAFIYPGIAAFVLLYLIAAWAICTGIFEILTSLQLRQTLENEWLPAVAGILSLIFGIILIAWPITEASAIVWLIAAYTILFGTLLLILGFQLRGWGRKNSKLMTN
ncbi:HdeD family acid-resistance protein [Nostoc parmelioides]|uniref:HdeD family acid-resistance protein n=1 Tax=Nostoc parmelioides FACHB-3921 TaxID=2692909 RepID=A0ABR8BE91_9NOSO|nr:HdeD family acid-resistance protein [Nostoc parmelioides]MBD2251332.1 HdeD family acid-resistance protein [Nostoc parmelioides FACHB-3921]